MSDELQRGINGEASQQVTDNVVQREKIHDLLTLNLGIGDALQLQNSSDSNLRYYVKLIGFLNKASVVVTHPLQNKKLLTVDDGQSFLVRGFSGRKSYEFNADVLSVGHAPYPFLHLSFPRQIVCLTMRGALRVKPNLAGWIEEKNFAQIKIPMIVVDISTSGARVHAKRQFGKIGDEVSVACRLPIDDEEQIFSISAVIRNSYSEKLKEDRGDMEVVTYGLEFIQPEGNVRMALQNYIYTTIASS